LQGSKVTRACLRRKRAAEKSSLTLFKKPRALDLQARGGHRLERVQPPVIDEVLAKLVAIIAA
jgi:hypothetical protein